VFSAEHDRFMDVSPVSFPPLAILPSLGAIDRSRTESPMGFAERYELNDWSLMGTGDILLLCTDGLTEHNRAGEPYVPFRLEEMIRRVKRESARAIYEAVLEDVIAFATPTDDLSIVVIKR
jgi:serine phosphatase RsbU (regulator of sigma subunit)